MIITCRLKLNIKVRKSNPEVDLPLKIKLSKRSKQKNGNLIIFKTLETQKQNLKVIHNISMTLIFLDESIKNVCDLNTSFSSCILSRY